MVVYENHISLIRLWIFKPPKSSCKMWSLLQNLMHKCIPWVSCITRDPFNLCSGPRCPLPYPPRTGAITVHRESKTTRLITGPELFPWDQIFPCFWEIWFISAFLKKSCLSNCWDFSKGIWMSCYLKNSESWLFTETQNIHCWQHLS